VVLLFQSIEMWNPNGTINLKKFWVVPYGMHYPCGRKREQLRAIIQHF